LYLKDKVLNAHVIEKKTGREKGEIFFSHMEAILFSPSYCSPFFADSYHIFLRTFTLYYVIIKLSEQLSICNFGFVIVR